MATVQITPPPLFPLLADELCTTWCCAAVPEGKGGNFLSLYVHQPKAWRISSAKRAKAVLSTLRITARSSRCGEGHEMPKERDETRAERDYGVNHNYEDEMLEAVAAANAS